MMLEKEEKDEAVKEDGSKSHNTGEDEARTRVGPQPDERHILSYDIPEYDRVELYRSEDKVRKKKEGEK